MIRNCWTFAVPRFEQRDGWLLVRFTRRSSARPSRLFGWLGVALVAAGVVAINWGAMLRTAGGSTSITPRESAAPYDSYEPDHGPAIKRPPWSFKNHVIQRDKL
jgi:hypothetical protein